MRPLISGSLLFAVLFLPALQAHGEAPSFRMTTNVHDESGTAGLITTTSPSSSSTLTTSLDGTSGSLTRNLSVRFGLDHINPDYSRYLILDRSGSATPLANSFNAPENVGRFGVDFTAQRLTLSVDGAQTISETPFPGGSVGLMGTYDSYEKGARYSLNLTRSDYSAPLSYFDAPETFQTLPRPTRLLEDRLTVAWEQVLTEMLKSRIETFVADHPQNQPSVVGGEAALAFALDGKSALIGKLGSAHQLQNTQIFDDRGYLDATWMQIEYRLEPAFRWALSAGAGTVYETESARGRFPYQRIGTDTLSIGARTREKMFEIGITALGAFSNTGYQSIQVGGDLLWQI